MVMKRYPIRRGGRVLLLKPGADAAPDWIELCSDRARVRQTVIDFPMIQDLPRCCGS